MEPRSVASMGQRIADFLAVALKNQNFGILDCGCKCEGTARAVQR